MFSHFWIPVFGVLSRETGREQGTCKLARRCGMDNRKSSSPCNPLYVNRDAVLAGNLVLFSDPYYLSLVRMLGISFHQTETRYKPLAVAAVAWPAAQVSIDLEKPLARAQGPPNDNAGCLCRWEANLWPSLHTSIFIWRAGFPS